MARSSVHRSADATSPSSAEHDHAGHGGHGDHVAQFRRLFWTMLGLAIPLVVSIATERAARGGVLVKGRLALESMRTVGAVLFDKTGTLTKGEPTVTAVAAASRAGAPPRVAAQ